MEVSSSIDAEMNPEYCETSSPIDVQIDNTEAMLAKVADIYSSKLMSDVCLVVNGRDFPAHRLILSASSSVFHVMLTSPSWTESSEARIVLQETRPCADIFQYFLQYLYSGKIRINQDTVMDILTLADKYDVKDLVRVCLDYMCSHIAHAGANNNLVSWMQYTLSCGHMQVAERCKQFLKWNIQLIANTDDFGNFEPELFVSLLQQNDLVVVDEMALYKIAVSWLAIQQDRLAHCHSNVYQARISAHLGQLTKAIMSHIRFPMMSPRQLAELLLSDLVNRHKEFFMDKMAIGMAFHSGQKSMDRVTAALATPHGRLLFTPRLYTADTYSTMLTIEKLYTIPAFHTRTLVFSSRVGCSYALPDRHTPDRGDETAEWVVDVYPKGVWFRKSWLINWQGTVEVPEHVLRTVRLSVCCRDHTCVRVKVGILMIGVRDQIEHVANVVEKNHCFDENNQLLNFDDLMDFDELNVPQPHSKCPYLVGTAFDSLKFHIVIAPLSVLSVSISPPFNLN